MSRIKKRFSVLICLIVVLSMVSYAFAYIPPGVTSSNLYALYVTQEKSNWCWVASAQNATIQEGCNTNNQYNVVYILKGQTPDFYPNVTGTINDTEAAAELMCNDALNYVVSGQKTYAFLSDKIYNGHSVIAGCIYFQNGNTYGHIVLLMGWYISNGTQYLKYFDPANGLYYTVTYSGLCDGTFNGYQYVQSCYVN